MEFHRSLEEAQCVVATSDTSTSDEANYCSRGGHSRQSSSSSFLERQSWADVVDEDDTLDDFDELDAGAAMLGTTVVCDGLSQGSLLHGTGRCKPCAFFYTKGCQSGVGCLFCHVCPPGEKKRRMQVHRRQSARAGRDRRRVAKCSRDVSKRSDCLIINETAVVNAHPTQNINSKFAECSIGTDGDMPGRGCQWVPVPADAWKDQKRHLPTSLCGHKRVVHRTSKCSSTQHVTLCES